MRAQKEANEQLVLARDQQAREKQARDQQAEKDALYQNTSAQNAELLDQASKAASVAKDYTKKALAKARRKLNDEVAAKQQQEAEKATAVANALQAAKFTWQQDADAKQSRQDDDAANEKKRRDAADAKDKEWEKKNVDSVAAVTKKFEKQLKEAKADADSRRATADDKQDKSDKQAHAAEKEVAGYVGFAKGNEQEKNEARAADTESYSRE